MNLYAYAGNNPITFRDPFGLDTVTVGHDPDGTLRAAVERCASSNTICAERYRAAHADHRIYTLSVGTLPKGKGGETQIHAHAVQNDPLGNEFDFGPQVEITIDPDNFEGLSADISNAFGNQVTFTIDDAVGHELGGHAAGSLLVYQAGKMNQRGGNPGHCDETCARQVDNVYRQQRGLSPIW